MSSSVQIAGFASYTHELTRELVRVATSGSCAITDPKIHSLLNGQASFDLRRTVPLETLRDEGIFFTDTALAQKATSYIQKLIKQGIGFADLACGAGNLLLSCAQHLPVGTSLTETIELWSPLISGSDIFDEFVCAAKLRLLLLAALRTQDTQGLGNFMADPNLFPGVVEADVFGSLDNNRLRNTCYIFNPPYGDMDAPAGCSWATGNVQSAGVYFERITNVAAEGQHIVAILPDVLRSGSRYSKWREAIEEKCGLLAVEPIGRFDDQTDVDVFIFHCVKGTSINSGVDWIPAASKDQGSKVISDCFEVHVGTIVPHRDKVEGQFYPYVHARTASPWQTIECLGEQIQTKRTVFKPPFIVIHRTSSPSDKRRCVATIIAGTMPIAVENHLIVLSPKDGSLKTCKGALKILDTEFTDDWMNNRIRCRHLTTEAIKTLPLAGL